ncbi:MAG: hypothetical protein BWY83_02586 [bacterium ADurb.Bin478]|nr:MAG: hypothetical protein BWY83_02586 [bacterium ADurb.Bin478]
MAVEIIDKKISQQPVDHDLGPFFHHRIPAELVQHEHGGEKEREISRRVELTLADGGGGGHPVIQPALGVQPVLIRAFAVEPGRAWFVGPALRRQIQRGVIHDPMVFGVAAIGRIVLQGSAHLGFIGRRHVLLPVQIHGHHRVQPEHVAARPAGDAVDDLQRGRNIIVLVQLDHGAKRVRAVGQLFVIREYAVAALFV